MLHHLELHTSGMNVVDETSESVFKNKSVWPSSLSKHQMANYPHVARVPQGLEAMEGLEWEAPAVVPEDFG